MNIAISEACKQASDAEKGKIEIRAAIPFVPESTVESDRTDKNKDEFISVTCRYRPSAGDSKKNNYVDVQGLWSHAPSELFMEESTKAYVGDCQGIYRENPRNQ